MPALDQLLRHGGLVLLACWAARLQWQRTALLLAGYELLGLDGLLHYTLGLRLHRVAARR